MTPLADRRLRLVMFDLDGTLIETAVEIRDAVNDTLRHFRLAPVARQQVAGWIGHGTRALLAQTLAYRTASPVQAVRASADFEAVAAEFGRHYLQRSGTRSRVYPHVHDVLHALRRGGVALALVTNKEAAFTRPLLQRHGLSVLLDHVLTGDTAPARKPDPAGLRACMSACGMEPGECLFVGDSSVDVAAARAAGVAVWAVEGGYNLGQPIAAAAPDRILADLRPLLDLHPRFPSPAGATDPRDAATRGAGVSRAR